MPFVNIKAVKGVMSEEDKARLIAKVTDVVVEIAGGGSEEFRQGTWVVIEEIEPSHWGAGGKPADLAAVRKMTGRS